MKVQKPIRIVVADDHQIVRHGIVSLLSLNQSLDVVAEASDGRAALEQTLALDPDVVLMDISMPEMNGLVATRQIKAKRPRVKVLVLSAYDNPEYVEEILQSGASGYLLKNTSPEELYAAIEAVYSGNAFFSPSISRLVLNGFLAAENRPASPATSRGPAPKTPLTDREREILRLIAEGKSHQQIARSLHISIRTVDTHRNNIMKKTGLHDTASLVTYAIREKIASL